MVKVDEKNGEPLTSQENDPSSISGEGSFVILDPPDSHRQFSSQVTGPPQLPSLNSYTYPEFETPVSLAEQIPSDLSAEELHKKIEEVVQHNLHLKELLYQNNLSLKQNYQILVAWKEELSKQQQKNNEKFAEHKQFTMKLIAENKELKRCLEETKDGNTDDLVSLKKENDELKKVVADLEKQLSLKLTKKESEMPSKKEQELIALVEQITKQLENAERARRQLTIDNEHLNAQKSRLEKEVDVLKADLELQKMKSLELKKQYEKQVSSSPQHVMSLERPSPAVIQLNEKTDFASSLESYRKHLQEINTNLEEKTESYTGLESWLQIAADKVIEWSGKPEANVEIVCSLKKEIQELRSLLIKEQNFGHEKKINLAEAQTQFQKLFSDYQELLEEWEKLHKEKNARTKQNSDYYETQIRGFTEKIDNITAQLMSKEESLAHKNKEIEQLNEFIKKLKLENEEISILKTQVEVYQSDFDAEREARANLAGEKDQLAEDMRLLQRRNDQLMQELEKYQNNRSNIPQNGVNTGWSTIATPGRVRLNSRNPTLTSGMEDRQNIYTEEVPPPKEFMCPKCAVTFRQLQQLEYHVESCLELTD